MNRCDESEEKVATRQRNLKQVFCSYNAAKRFFASMVFLLISFFLHEKSLFMWDLVHVQ